MTTTKINDKLDMRIKHDFRKPETRLILEIMQLKKERLRVNVEYLEKIRAKQIELSSYRINRKWKVL